MACAVPVGMILDTGMMPRRKAQGRSCSCRSLAPVGMLPLLSSSLSGRRSARRLRDPVGVVCTAAGPSVPPAAAAASSLRTLESLNWDNTFVRELPADPVTTNEKREVRAAYFSYVDPTPPGANGARGDPSLVSFSPEAAALLDLAPGECERPEFAMAMAGAAALAGSECYAQCYGGHQFGTWAGQLGDGRAITLGEVVNASGERWELQLKGAGQTPYSRNADGRAVLRSSVREYVASESMHHLGVPTTRALCLAVTGEEIWRDEFYNGDARREPAAVVCRLAPSFVRFGTFQLPVSRGIVEAAMVPPLMAYMAKHHLPSVGGGEGAGARLLREAVERTAALAAQWQSLGFVHGVLNTDNMSILGLTIDYGPFGFMERFDPDFTPNASDFGGRRYCWSAQPNAVSYNVVQLGNALLGGGVVTKEEAQAEVNRFRELYHSGVAARWAAKLGLNRHDEVLLQELLGLMEEDGADFTNTFRSLSLVDAGVESPELPMELEAAVAPWGVGMGGGGGDGVAGAGELPAARRAAWRGWLARWAASVRAEGREEGERRAAMDATNPKYIPRNWLMQVAIDEAEGGGGYGALEELCCVLRRPYEDQPGQEVFAQRPPAWAARPGVAHLSCSS